MKRVLRVLDLQLIEFVMVPAAGGYAGPLLKQGFYQSPADSIGATGDHYYLMGKEMHSGIYRQAKLMFLLVLHCVIHNSIRIIFSKIGGNSAKSEICHSLEECIESAQKLGYPLVVRPSFTMGGICQD